MPGSTGSFEVMVNGKLAFSKLQTKQFPDTKEVVHMVAQVDQGETLEAGEKEEAAEKGSKKRKNPPCVVQ